MTDWQAVPIFGVPDSRLPHIVRPSAYGLIVGPSDRLAIVRTEIGSYLPGGGILGTESPEAAICREHVMRVALHRGSASQATPTAMPVSTSATPHMRSKLIHARRTTCSAARSYTITANSAVISR